MSLGKNNVLNECEKIAIDTKLLTYLSWPTEVTCTTEYTFIAIYITLRNERWLR